MNKGFITKLFLYGLSSGVALVVDFGLLTLLVQHFSMYYLYAAAIGFSAGCVVTYIASKYFVFEDRSNSSQTITASLFVLVGIGGLLLNQLILYIGVDLLSVDYRISKIASAGIVFWFNFLIRGFFVFKDPDLCKTQ